MIVTVFFFFFFCHCCHISTTYQCDVLSSVIDHVNIHINETACATDSKFNWKRLFVSCAGLHHWSAWRHHFIVSCFYFNFFFFAWFSSHRQSYIPIKQSSSANSLRIFHTNMCLHKPICMLVCVKRIKIEYNFCELHRKLMNQKCWNIFNKQQTSKWNNQTASDWCHETCILNGIISVSTFQMSHRHTIKTIMFIVSGGRSTVVWLM